MLYISDKKTFPEVSGKLKEGDEVYLLCKPAESFSFQDVESFLSCPASIHLSPCCNREEQLIFIGTILASCEKCTILDPTVAVPSVFAEKVLKPAKIPAKKRSPRKKKEEVREEEPLPFDPDSFGQAMNPPEEAPEQMTLFEETPPSPKKKGSSEKKEPSLEDTDVSQTEVLPQTNASSENPSPAKKRSSSKKGSAKQQPVEENPSPESSSKTVPLEETASEEEPEKPHKPTLEERRQMRIARMEKEKQDLLRRSAEILKKKDEPEKIEFTDAANEELFRMIKVKSSDIGFSLSTDMLMSRILRIASESEDIGDLRRGIALIRSGTDVLSKACEPYLAQIRKMGEEVE